MFGGGPSLAPQPPPGFAHASASGPVQSSHGEEAHARAPALTSSTPSRQGFAVQSAFVTEPELCRDLMQSDLAHRTLRAPAYGDSRTDLGPSDQGVDAAGLAEVPSAASASAEAPGAAASATSDGSVPPRVEFRVAGGGATSFGGGQRADRPPAAAALGDLNSRAWVLQTAMREAQRCRRERREAREERRRMAELTRTLAVLMAEKQAAARRGRKQRPRSDRYADDGSDGDSADSDEEILHVRMHARHASRRARRAIRHCKELERELEARDLREARRRRKRRLQTATVAEAAAREAQRQNATGAASASSIAAASSGSASSQLYLARDVWLLVLATLLVVAAVILMIAGAARLLGAKRPRQRTALTQQRDQFQRGECALMTPSAVSTLAYVPMHNHGTGHAAPAAGAPSSSGANATAFPPQRPNAVPTVPWTDLTCPGAAAPAPGAPRCVVCAPTGAAPPAGCAAFSPHPTLHATTTGGSYQPWPMTETEWSRAAALRGTVTGSGGMAPPAPAGAPSVQGRSWVEDLLNSAQVGAGAGPPPAKA